MAMQLGAVTLLALCCLLTACDNQTTSSPTQPNREAATPQDRGQPARSSSDEAADRALTQRIRQALMDDETLSINAKNIKITTANGVVTLRGVVITEKEKGQIHRKIKGIEGVKEVDNRLEASENKGERRETREGRNENQ